MNSNQAYSRLDLAPGASDKEIDAAFRKKAAKLHPDVNKSETAEKDFKELNEAYQFLKSGKQNMDQTYSSGFGFGFDPSDIMSQFKIHFKDAFGGDFFHTAPPKAVVIISFAESVLGCEKNVTYKRVLSCKPCGGSGYVSEETDKECEKCNGTKVREINGKDLPCNSCRGSGKFTSRNFCSACLGKKVKETDFTVNIRIPPGTKNGALLTLPGGGDFSVRSNLGTYTNAQIRIMVEPDNRFRVVGNNIVSTVELTLLEALVGVTKNVSTIIGDKPLKIPPSRRNGDQLEAEGLGIPPVGKHIFVLDVKYPDNIQNLISFLKDNYNDGYIQGAESVENKE